MGWLKTSCDFVQWDKNTSYMTPGVPVACEMDPLMHEKVHSFLITGHTTCPQSSYMVVPAPSG